MNTISSRTVFKVLFLATAFIGVLAAVYLVRIQLIWIGTAAFIAIALNPLVERLVKWMPKKSRIMAVSAVFVLMATLLILLLALLLPPVVKQSEQLVSNIPSYSDELTHGNSWVASQVQRYNLVDRIHESQDQLLGYLSAASGSFLTILRTVFSSFAAGITVLGLTFFMLLEGPRWLTILWRLVPARHRKRGQYLAGRMYETVSGYVTGNLLTSLLAAALSTVVMTVVGVPYSVSLGILVGVLDLLPLVGATIAATMVVVVAMFGSIWAGGIMLIFFIIYQQVENHVLQPWVYGRTVQMSPLLVLISVLIGAGLGGILGALVAIPAGASLQILVRDIVERRFPS